MNRRIHCSLFLSIYTVVAAIAVNHSNAAHFSGVQTLMCGFSDTLDSLTGSIKQIEQFFTAAYQFFDTIKAVLSVAGIATVALFIAVIVLSTGLSALGIRRGTFSFIVSLAAADAFWFAWERALGHDAASFAPSMIRSTILLLAPLGLVICARLLAPLLKRGWIKAVQYIRHVKKGEFSPETAMDLVVDLERKAGALRESILGDVKKSMKKQSFALSDTTVEARRSLERTLKKI